MEKRQDEDRLLKAFRGMCSEEQELLVLLAEARASAQVKLRPKFQLVSAHADPSGRVVSLRRRPG